MWVRWLGFQPLVLIRLCSHHRRKPLVGALNAQVIHRLFALRNNWSSPANVDREKINIDFADRM